MIEIREKVMKKMGMAFIKRHKVLLAVIATCLLCLAFILMPFIILKMPFILGLDYRLQYTPFWEEFVMVLREAFRNRTLPFYSWYSFLGNNFWTTRLFYYQNIYDYLFIIFRDINYNVIQMAQLSLKCLVAALSFYAYARHRKYSDLATYLLSLVYAFSSFTLDAAHNPFFLSFYTFVPLYFLGVELFLEKNKKSMGFVLITALLITTNYYQFYSLSVLTPVYYIYRYYQLKGTLKGSIVSAFPLIGLYLIGVMISGFATAPNIYALLNNSRVGKSSASWTFSSIKPYLGMILGTVIPANFMGMFHIFTANMSDIYMTLWCGSFAAICLVQAFFNKKRQEDQVLLILLFGMLAIPYADSFMHGLSEPCARWTQFILFFMIIIAREYLEDLDQISNKLLITSVIVYSILIATVPYLLIGMCEAQYAEKYTSEYLSSLVFIVFLLGDAWVIYRRNKRLLTVFVVAELCVASCLAIPFHDHEQRYTWDLYYGVNYTLDKPGDIQNYLETLDDSDDFYRIYADYNSVYWSYSANQNMHYGIMGTMAYDSMIASASYDLNKIAYSDFILSWGKNITDPNLLTMACSRYALGTDPYVNSREASLYNGWLVIYENLDYINFGKMYDQVISYDEYNGDTSLVIKNVICNSEDLNSIKALISEGSTSEVEYAHTLVNGFEAGVKANKAGFFVTGLQYDEGFTVKVNGTEATKYRVSGGFMGFTLDEGYNEIEISYMPPGLGVGLGLSIAGLVMLAGVAICIYKKERFN